MSSGDLGSIIGLLEDLHRYVDGMPPRKGENYYYDGPYLGKFKFQSLSISEPQALESYKTNRVDTTTPDTRRVSFNLKTQDINLEK